MVGWLLVDHQDNIMVLIHTSIDNFVTALPWHFLHTIKPSNFIISIMLRLTAISSSWFIKRSPSEPGRAGYFLWNARRLLLSWFYDRCFTWIIEERSSQMKPPKNLEHVKVQVPRYQVPGDNPYEDLPLLEADLPLCPPLERHCTSTESSSSEDTTP